MKTTSFRLRAFALAASLLIGAGCAAATGAAPERPNIVWLVSEDDSVHYLRLYDEGGAPMPHVESLAAQGLVFDHAFSNAPVCSTARSTIISGSYGPRVLSQYHRRAALVPLPEGQHMFPRYLREAGYHTTNNSKQDYNFLKEDGVWDASSNKASYRSRQPGQPFFHVQNFGTTHEGRLHFSQEELETKKTVTNPKTVSVFPIHPDTELFRYTNARYRDLHRELDEEIGTFLARLEADGLSDDTIIFYYGDHGGVLPGSKGYLYERGLHVPMVVYIPEKWQHLAPAAQGSRVDGFVEFVDLGPTVLNLAGIDVPSSMDGSPFLGKGVTLEGLNARDTTFSYADRFDEKYDLVRALRKGKYKYMRNYQPFNVDGLQNNYRYQMLAYEEWRELFQAGKLNAAQSQFFEPRPSEALYDVEADPFETNNLAGQPEHAQTLRLLRRELQGKVCSLPDLSFFPEPYLMQEAVANPVAFGQANRAEIKALVETADLSLLPWKQAQAGIGKALAAEDPWQRYWGLIACSSFGEQAKGFAETAKTLAATDPETLVRMRAAEFLGLNRLADPRPALTDCLKRSKSVEEAALVLNTIALLHDSALGYPFTLDRDWVPAKWLGNRQSNVARRYAYINGTL